MRTVVVRNGTRIPLGKQGENKAVRVVWPEIAEKYTKLYGDGRFELVVVQKGQAYPAVVNVDGPDLIWNVLAADVATVGAGSLELIYYVGDTIAKSQTWETFVEASKSAEGTTDPPEPAKNWVDTVLKSSSDAKQSATESAESARQSAESSTNAQQAAEKAENAVGHAPIIGENGNWFVWDFVQSKYVDTGKAASTPPINTDTAGKHLVNDGEKSKWQDMSPLIVSITKDGQDESGEPIYKSDKTFDEIKAAYDIGREIKLVEIGVLDSEILQIYCGSEPKLLYVSDDEAYFICVGTATALFNNAFNSMASYGGIPTFMIAITINKLSDGDVVRVESSFRIDEEARRPVFEPEAITKLSSSSGAAVFYIDLEGNYPDYTCPVAMADIKAAYEAGKVLECRCMMEDFPVTLPLFVPVPVPVPDANAWIFSGAGMEQIFTVLIVEGSVQADYMELVDVDGELPNPYSLTITNGSNRVTYDGREPVSINIDTPDSGNFATKQEAQGYVTAHNEDTAAHQDIRTALKPKACLVTLESSGWDATAKTQVVAVSSVVADEPPQIIHTIPKTGQITDYNATGIQLVGRGAGNVTFMCATIPEKDVEVWVVTEDVEDVTPSPPGTYLTFSSPHPFTLKATNGKTWDGTLEYSYDTRTWTTWNGTTRLQPPEGYHLYMRGIGNTKITGSGRRWELTGTDIACTGNIENLLDYTVVKRGEHPVMANGCYENMFSNCTSLTTAPELPATALAKSCYDSMFDGCTGLTTAPSLPATTLAPYCYYYMFNGCTGLTTAPSLPATTLAQRCYASMFQSCSNLTTAPELPATALDEGCYDHMFSWCTGLTTAPELPATTLASLCYQSMFENCQKLTTAPSLPATTLDFAYSCYSGMFSGCTGLTTAPELPATTLAQYCYQSMFQSCSSLTTAPELPATALAKSCYDSMFDGCTGLTTAPSLPATTLAPSCYYSMFDGCMSLTTVPSLPATTLEESCYSGMFSGCINLKFSDTKTDSYTIPYRIPSADYADFDQDSLTDMFAGTGGTFVGTPEINTTYYLDKSNSIA